MQIYHGQRRTGKIKNLRFNQLQKTKTVIIQRKMQTCAQDAR